MDPVEVHVIDSLFGVCYQIALIVSAKIYSMFASTDVLYGGTVALFFLFIFLNNHLRSMFRSVTVFSGDSGGFTENNPLQKEFLFKLIFSIILLILLFLPIKVKLIIDQQVATLHVPPNQVEVLLRTIGLHEPGDTSKKICDVGTENSESENGEMAVVSTYVTCTEPYIVGLSLGLVDIIYDVIKDGLIGLFPDDILNQEDVTVKNFNIFAEFSVSSTLLDIKSKLFQGMSDVAARVPELISITKPGFLYRNNVIPSESSVSKMPKLNGVLFLPSDEPLSISEANAALSNDVSVDNYIPSVALYIILNKFNYLSKYGSELGNISVDKDPNSNYNISSFTILKEDLDYFKSDTILNDDNYLQYFYNKRQHIPHIGQAMEKDEPWNLNQLSNLDNLLLAHPELAIFLLNVYSWVRFDGNSDEVMASLDAYAANISDPEEKRKFENSMEVYSSINVATSAATGVSDNDYQYLFNANIDNFLNAKEKLYDKLSKIEQNANSSIKEYNASVKEYLNFLSTYFSGNTVSLSTILFGQVSSGSKIRSNTFSFTDDNYSSHNWEFYKDLKTKVIEDQIIETSKLINTVSDYLTELNAVKDQITISKNSNADNNFSLIGQGGLSYLNSTIEFWDSVLTTANTFHDQLKITREYLDSFTQVAEEASKKYSTKSPEEIESSGFDMLVKDLKFYKSTNKMAGENDGRYILYNIFAPIAKQYDDNENEMSSFKWEDFKNIGKHVERVIVTTIVSAVLWVVLYIFLLLTFLLLFYIMIQRIVAFIMFFCCWPILFFKAASSSKLGQPIIAIITSWASYRAFDISIIVGLLFSKILQSLTVNTGIYGHFIYGEYSQRAIQSLMTAMVIFSILISLLIIRFLYTSLNGLITNNFDVVSESLNKVADKAIASAGQMSSLAIGGAKLLGTFIAGSIPFIGGLLAAGTSALGGAAQKGVEKGSSDIKDILDNNK